MSKATDSGKAFLDQVLAKLPESLRGEAAKAFTAPEAADALTLLGDGVLARTDYSKSMDALKEKETTLTEDYERLSGWYDQNKERLATVETLEAQIAKLQGAPPPTPADKKAPEPSVGLTREDLLKTLNERDAGYAQVLALSTTLTAKHLRDFDEVLDMNAVISHAQTKKLALLDAYRDKYAEQIKTKADKAEAERIQKLVDARLDEERKKFGTDQPYPLRNASPSVLDVIEQKGDPTKYSVDSALAEYERLQSTRG